LFLQSTLRGRGNTCREKKSLPGASERMHLEKGRKPFREKIRKKKKKKKKGAGFPPHPRGELIVHWRSPLGCKGKNAKSAGGRGQQQTKKSGKNQKRKKWGRPNVM